MRKSDGRPRHQQIAAGIRARIMAGDLVPGTRLPTTQQLMAEYGITNQTVQRTLSVLKDEGFLVGKAGVGVFVREEFPLAIEPVAYLPLPEDRQPYPWISEAVKRGQVGVVKLLEVTTVQPPAAVAEVLGERVNLRHQVLMLDGEPTPS